MSLRTIGKKELQPLTHLLPLSEVLSEVRIIADKITLPWKFIPIASITHSHYLFPLPFFLFDFLLLVGYVITVWEWYQGPGSQ